MHNPRLLVCFSLAFALVACSGGGAGPVSGSAKSTTTTGTISGFGSIVINGVHYESDSASVRFDDADVAVSALSAGQVVTISGSSDDNGHHRAGSVLFDSSVLGPVTSLDALNNSFVALGQTVLVSSSTVYANATGLSDLSTSAIVRVSGDRDASGNIVAGFVELLATAPSAYRLSGSISNLSGTQFSIGAETIDASAAVLQPTGTTLADGLSVVVVGTLDANDSSGATLLASKVRLRKLLDGAPDGSRGEVEGIITSAEPSDASSGSFSIDSAVVHYDASTQISRSHGSASAADLIAGNRVEVHGTLNSDGSLQATRIELQRSPVSSGAQLGFLMGTLSTDPDTGAGSISLLGTTVQIDSSTVFIDRSDRANKMFSLADLAAGSLVQVAVSEQGDPLILTALKVELPRRTPAYSAVGGPFSNVDGEAFTLTVSTVPVLAQSACSTLPRSGEQHGEEESGRPMLSSDCTLYFIHGQMHTQAEFFAALADPDNVNASVMALGNDANGSFTANLLDLQARSLSGDASEEAD